MPDNCVFCHLIGGEEPAHVVFEDELSVAFLDVRPLFPGHVLLVPKTHYPKLPNVDTDLVPALFSNVQLLSKAVTLATESEGSFVATNNKVNQSITHLHVHIVPSKRKDGRRCCRAADKNGES